ncbi:MAG: sugar phosphate isomerase/epimerase family protein [Niameybacter sp.]|uniref:sugar phosphate isomerase/epimerase family protein n=1 Tax=Niameybacter sp. TaxID=2033640 RepID=UPI002FCCAD58
MLYISQLLETHRLVPLLEAYPIGLEVISFSIGFVLDDVEASIDHYQKEFSALSQETPLTFHGPFLDLLPGTCDKKVRELARTRFEAGYQAAKTFGVKHMIFHTGYMPNTYPDVYWLENVIHFWQDFLKDKLEDCTFYVENVLDLDWQLLHQLIDAIDHPHFKVCLDVGHVKAYSRRSVNEWIQGLGDRIGYVHLHNNDGSRDAHAGLLNGTIPMKDVLSQLRVTAPDAHWSLEVSDEVELKRSIEWLMEQKLI